jgi:hypothetical protein
VSSEALFSGHSSRPERLPRLILHALQVNMNGGRLPEPEANGRRYLKFPLDGL